jgi:hypothetical protein
MANRRRKFPTFFSIEIGPVRGIAESMGDAEWGTWSKKALSDLSIGCIRKDTDPRVKELFNSSKDRMDTEYQRKHDWYEKKKTAGAPTREDGEFKSGSGNAVKLESATPAKPSLAYAGKNGLVRLTDDEYALLLQELGNKRKADRLIDDLDYKLAEGATFRQPHLHVLTHWQSYREDKAAEAAEMAKVNADARAEAYSKRGYKTAEERQQEELSKINDFCTGLRNGTIKIAKEG